MTAGLDVRLRKLSASECLALLATVAVGRLAVTRDALPSIVPVSVRLVDGELAITSLLAAVNALTQGSVVALEAGTLGDGLAPEWTVEVIGILRSADVSTIARPIIGDSADRRLSLESVRGWIAEVARAGADGHGGS